MARSRNPLIVLGPDGKPLSGASVQTNLRPSGSAASVYSGETGGTAGSNPATTDANGKVVQWLDRGAYSSVVTATGLTTYSEPWDAAPGGDAAVDTAWLAAAIAYHKPGDLRHTAIASVETGWLVCEGQAVSRATYAALFSAIGTAYGEGDKSTTFNVPDFRERIPLPKGASLALAAKGGAATHTLTAGEMPKHGHTATDSGHTHAGASGNSFMQNNGPEHFKVEGSGYGIGTSASTASTKATISNSEAGSSEAHSIMQPYTVCNVWVKT